VASIQSMLYDPGRESPHCLLYDTGTECKLNAWWYTAQEPFNIGSTAQLQVAVTFDDGVVRDFTNDTRIVLTLVAGSMLCSLSAQNGE
jgi:hypothetical protein